MEVPIVLFDGVCNFCSASVQFVIKRNAQGQIQFCPIQSPTGQKLLADHGLADLDLTSIVLIKNGQSYLKSSAALRIAGLLDRPWPLLSVFLVVPRFIRDAVYDWIGNRRYRWWGRRESCWVPSESISKRFLP